MDAKLRIAAELLKHRPCCCPRGLADLRNSVQEPGDLLKDDFLEVVRHMAEQIDLTNFDQELAHSGMRAVLQMTCGRSMDFATAAELRLGSQIADFHRYLAPPQPRKRRGRPKQKCAAKRKRFDAWNAFVQEHRPTQAGQASIKSGYSLN